MNSRHVLKFIQRFSHVLLIFIMISGLLAACRWPWQPTDEAPTEEVVPKETEAGGFASSEPRKDLPPALVEVSPLPGSLIALKQPITLYFNQPMDKESVEAAIHFDPGISGGFSWRSNRIVTFTPDQHLAADSELNLVVKTSAQASNEKNLREVIDLDFQTVDTLQVIQTVPSDGTQEVDPESAVFMVFNQPVVSLGREAETGSAFKLTPEVPGTGEWLNTSTYIFTPDTSMEGGTTYSVDLNEELVATSGAGLDSLAIRHSNFSTTQPAVLNILPMSDEMLSINGPVEIQFNIRMDPVSVEDHFSLMSSDGMEIEGFFEWDEGFKKCSFTPKENLDRNSTYKIQLESGAVSFGGLPVQIPIDISRITYPFFSVDPQTAPIFKPYSSQFGQYTIQFTTPLNRKIYKSAISILPEVIGKSTYLNADNTNMNLSGYFKPETEYTVTLDAALEDKWGEQLGESVTYTFFTPSAEPSLNIAAGYTSNNLVFVPASTSEIVLQATNINTVTLDLSPISIDDLITLLHPDNYDYRQIFLPESLETSVQNLNLTRNVSEVVRLPLSYHGNSLTSGAYFLRVSSQDITDESEKSKRLFLVVSENNLVMKISPEQALVWATRLKDYSPLADAPISIYNTEGNLVTSGQMDAYGLFHSTFERIDKPYSNFFSLVGEPGQEDFAFSISTWGASSILYQMGISFDTLPPLTDAYIYTDRPIYRPGDTVNFKALIFSRDNGLPLSSSLDAVNISVFSDGGPAGVPDKIYSKDLSLNQYGAVEDQVVLPDNAPTGMYRIEVLHGEVTIGTLYFDVAAYRKPNIELAVEMDENDFFYGDDITGNVQADYYFGLPAADQSLSWALFSDDAYFYLPGYRVGPLNTFWLMPRSMEFSPLGITVDSGETKTDTEGHTSLAFSTTDLLEEEFQEGSLNELTLEVTITDESGLPVSYRHSALIHPEEFYIGVHPETFFGSANTAFEFTVLTVDWNKQVVGNKALEATFETIEWQVEETPDIEMPYLYVEQTSLIGTSSPITDSEGSARVSFTPPDPGTYRLTIRAGNAVTQVLVWVYGESGAVWPNQSQNRINLTADASDYQPGQIAQVFIPNPFEGEVNALVTVERGLVMETQVLTITGAGHTLPVSIVEESIPNVYVSVIILGKDSEGRSNYRQGMLNLSVAPLSKTLNIDLSILPAETEPGETVSATLTITDVMGNPVQGEFSVAVVDKALLALVEANSLPILEALYAEQPLSVQTSLSLKTYASQLALINLDLGRGGGGGMGAQPVLREDFPDTAFWEANVITGADGTAQIQIPMPDTLTTWVVNVRGLSVDYLVGQAEAEILSQKDLMIQPVTPRFLVDGDEVEMSALVFNNTQQTLTVDVSLQSVGFTLIDGIQETQTVTIDPGDHEPVVWRGIVGSVEIVNLVFKAESGDYSDASTPIWGDLEVKRYVMPYTFSTTGQIAEEGDRLELVSLPMSTDPSSGELMIELTPSLSATLVEGLEALESHSYDDTVSILSRLLANLNAFLALSDLGIDTPELQSNLADLVDEGIHKLLAAQNYDGGWSWWVKGGSGNTNSDVFITAYVLLGLEQASEAGLDIGEGFIERGVEFLSGRIEQPGSIADSWELNQLVFQLYALRNRLSISNSLIDGLYARRSELSTWSLGLLGLTIREFEGMSDRVATLIADLEAMAIRSATGVHWESDRGSWLLPGTAGFNSAVAVFTLAQLDPASTSLSLGLQYLVNLRRSDGLWSSTFESAWSLMAMTEALKGTGDFQAKFNFHASLNDTMIAEGTADGMTPMTAVTTTLPIDTLFPSSPNALLIERDAGSGTLYYRVDLQTYQLADSAEAVNRGINLQRDYYLMGESCPELDECEPIQSLTLDPNGPSQIIKVVLTATISHDMFNFMLEDFIPAGTEILNRNLLTSQTLTEDILPAFNPRSPFMNGWGWWLFNAPQIYDDQILWTADYVPAGTYTLTYELVPYLRGDFQVLPAHAWQYFYPEVQGTSAGELFTID